MLDSIKKLLGNRPFIEPTVQKALGERISGHGASNNHSKKANKKARKAAYKSKRINRKRNK